MRKLDNVHLCPEGSARYADALLADMTAVFRLAPATGDWSQGSWTSDPDFNNPPGACPDDHPSGLRRRAEAQEQAELVMMRSALAADFALAQLEPTSATTSYQ